MPSTAGVVLMSDESEPAQRPDSDDYDLLTYGEVGARIVEVLADERGRLAELRSAVPSDAAAIQAAQVRIAQLTEAAERYRHQADTAETFMRRFGLKPRSRV
jgi:hypothetical protein